MTQILFSTKNRIDAGLTESDLYPHSKETREPLRALCKNLVLRVEKVASVMEHGDVRALYNAIQRVKECAQNAGPSDIYIYILYTYFII